jgi:L,D-transpeptidase catalytic domain
VGGDRRFSTGQRWLAGSFLPESPFWSAPWRIALIAAAGFMCAASPLEAAPSAFWPDYYEPYVPPRRPVLSRVRKPHKFHLPKPEDLAKDARKPQGPLVLAISIEKQNLKIYDANGLFAETPVSTGMRGHPTPMGVFSVIQKHKYHRSNIYSGAPMPYMQRITWSGVAMHAGVLPGYPASHGCIRMPMTFAVKMWSWTRMGARVVIAPGELSPASFSHPLLATRKTAAVAAAEPENRIEVAVTAKSDKAAMAAPPVAPDAAEASVELKPTIGHELTRTHTADAGNALAGLQPLTAVDAPAVSGVEAATDAARAIADGKKDETRPSDAAKPPAPKPEAAAAKRNGPIAVLVSKKDGKLYVRQNFAPLFDVAVTIAPDDRALGTHIFTAQTDKDDASQLHWSAVSMPVMARQPRLDDERGSRRRKTTGAIEVSPAPPPDSAAEALDRLTIPADARARINEMLSSGSSIIVSDQAVNTGETGEGTDFIIPLR